MRRLPAFAVLLCLLLVSACGEANDPPGPGTPVATPPGSEPAVRAPLDWVTRTGAVSFANGWTAEFCEGDGPFICVRDGGSVRGTLELLNYPMEGSHDVRERIEDHYTTLREDRGIGCPDYDFTADPPAAATIDGLAGMRYGFTLTAEDGTVSERTLGWMLIHQDSVVVVTANSSAPGLCPGEEVGKLVPADLAEIAAELDVVVATMVLPDGERTAPELAGGEHIARLSVVDCTASCEEGVSFSDPGPGPGAPQRL